MNYRLTDKILCIILLLATLIGCDSKTISDDTDGNLYRIRVADKFGFINSKGKIVIEPQFDDAELLFSEGLCVVSLDGTSVIIDTSGSVVANIDTSIHFDFQNIECDFSPFVDGIKGIKEIFFLNNQGNILESQLTHRLIDYQSACGKHFHFFRIFTGKDTTLIAPKGIQINNKLFILDKAAREKWWEEEGMEKYENKHLDPTLFNKNGEFKNSRLERIFRNTMFRKEFGNFPHYDNMKEMSSDARDSYFAYWHGRVGSLLEQALSETTYIIENDKGDTIGESYEMIRRFSKGLCAVKKAGKWGYIDSDGFMKINTSYDIAFSFSEDGMARVKQGNRHLYIDIKGNENISVDSSLTDFHCGRAAAIMNGEKCIIDIRGNKVCQIDADSICPFDTNDCLATIIKKGKASKIDTNGAVVLETDYDYLGAFVGGIAPVKKKKKWGYIDTANNVVVEIKYEGFFEFINNTICDLRAVYEEINDVLCFSYYDLKGNLVWQDTPPAKRFHDYDAYAWGKKEYIDYFKNNLSSLDPIEGLYYVTIHSVYVDRDNANRIGSNGTKSKIYAVIRDFGTDEFVAWVVDESKEGKEKGYHWLKKIEKLGESGAYAVKEYYNENDESRYGDDTRLILDNPCGFEISIETGHNGWYNFYSNYVFLKDYPTASEYENNRLPEWTGTGFAIAEGYVVTNHHVVDGAKNITIKCGNDDETNSYKAFLVASDKEHDLAIIKIIDKSFEGYGNIPYGIRNDGAEVGDEIFVLGYPMTQTMGEEIKLTTGVISSASGFKGNVSMYQISAAVQPGNSGAPLFDADGNVIGVVCAKHAEAENANYAVKMTYLYNLVKKSGIGLKLDNKNRIKSKKLNKKVKSIKDYVFIIECSRH